MMLTITYSTPGMFTMGELRALIAQQKELPDEANIYLKGTLSEGDGDGSDKIVIEWDEA